MKKILTITTIFFFSVISSHAQSVASAGFAKFSVDDLDFGLGYLSYGYEMEISDTQWTIVPELRYGIGISDESIGNRKFEVGRFTSLAVRAQYAMNDVSYVYAAPVYTNLEMKYSYPSFSRSETESEFGGAIGAGYNFSDAMGAEIFFEKYTDSDVFGIGFKYRF